MRVIREIEVAGLKVQVKELTVGEIRAWMKDASAAGGDLVDAALGQFVLRSDFFKCAEQRPDYFCDIR